MKKKSICLKLILLSPIIFIIISCGVGEIDPEVRRAEEEKAAKIEVAEAAAVNDEIDYINNNLQVIDFQTRYMNSLLDGKIAGATFRIKNNGDRTITYIKVTIYFKDNAGNIIFEDDAIIMNSNQTSYFRDNDKPLKPNYIWSMEKDKFSPSEKCPKEWQEGNADIKIVDIDFE